MKSIFLFLVFVITTLGCTAQENYKLSIKKFGKEKIDNKVIWLLKTTLINNSKDTLTFLNMSCDTEHFYRTNKDRLEIKQKACDKNFPVLIPTIHVVAGYLKVENSN